MRFCSLLITLLISFTAHAKHFVDPNGQYYQFVSPYPQSEFNNINTLIAIRQGEQLDITDIIANPDLISISSNEGLNYDYTIVLLSDGKTINIDPIEDFELNSTIHVVIAGLKIGAYNQELAPLEIHFTTSSILPASYRRAEILAEMGLDVEEEIIEGDRVYPTITTIVNTNPSNGNIFMGTAGLEKYIAILDSAGTEPIWFQLSGLNGNDFKVNRNNMLTYFNREIFT